MKTRHGSLFGVVILCLLATAVVGCRQQAAVAVQPAITMAASEATPESQWVDLFNGRDLSGWSGDPAVWGVQDGAITAHKIGEHNKDILLLWQGGELSDFDLRYKVRNTRKTTNEWSNGGVFFRSILTNGMIGVGYLADNLSSTRVDTKIMELGGRRFLSQAGKTTLLSEGGAIDQWKVLATADDTNALKKSLKQSDWNDVELSVRGPRITLRFNGVIAADVIDMNTSKRRLVGALALKMWMSSFKESAVVQFKDIKLKDWSKFEPVIPKQPINLLAGTLLEQFTPWVGKSEPGEDPDGVFTLSNGILKISGTQGGFLTTRREFKNYHLVAEFKWGEATWGARKEQPRNSGIWVHTHPGVFRNGEGYECQIREDDTGSLYMSLGTLGNVGSVSKTLRFQRFGRPGVSEGKVKGFRSSHEIEMPFGEWNRFEVICFGNRLTIIVNGTNTVQAENLDPSSGAISVESTNAELEFRKLELLPLDEKR